MSKLAWSAVAAWLRSARTTRPYSHTLKPDQLDTLEAIAGRIERHGVIVADEVGRGKTRVACAVVEAVIKCGGRAAVVAPRGLMHQWTTEYASLQGQKPTRGRKAIQLTTVGQWLADQPPSPTRARDWWLISHGFQYPMVREDAALWRCALPSMVLSALHPGESTRGRTALRRAAKMADEVCGHLPALRAMAQRIAESVRQGGSRYSKLREQLLDLPLLGQDEATVRADFQPDRPSWMRARELLGIWMGPFDLVVIDEAHKSRTPAEDDPKRAKATREKVLPELLRMLKAPGQRRLSLTATPMEFEAEDWARLVDRTIPGQPTRVVKEAAEAYLSSVRAVKVAPDDVERLVRLEEAAGRFQAALEPFVTRRRLLSPEDLAEFRVAFEAGSGRSPHPHRRKRAHQIALDSAQLGSASRAMVLALEGYSRTSRGRAEDDRQVVEQRVKTLYTRIAAGVEVDDDEVVAGLDTGGARRGHLAETRAHLDRMAFWLKEYRRAQKALRREAKKLGAGQLPPGLVHPRLDATVEAIEEWTNPGKGSKPEKVLVFGTYKAPLHNLRAVVEVRYWLQAIDSGLPIPLNLAKNRLWPLAVWQYARMSAKGQLRGALSKGRGTWAVRLKRLATAAFKQHDRLRRRVAEAVAAYLHGHSDLQASPFREPLGVILRARVLDQLAADGATEPPPAKKLQESIAEVVNDLRGAAKDSDAEPSTDEVEGDALARIHEDLEEEAKELKFIHSGYCRVMTGETRWEVRRAIQDGFNREDAFPRVVIAQSRVGREGLNLHEACRVLVQFHPEWNPGVVEQQIGRIDRLESYWKQEYEAWKTKRADDPPRIEVVRVIYQGTYDAYQQEVLAKRTADFDATLFGDLLSPEAWARVPAEWKRRLELAVPDFSPRRARARRA